MSETDSDRETEVFFKTRADASLHQQRPEENDDSQLYTTLCSEDQDEDIQDRQENSPSMAEEVKKMMIKQNELTELVHGLANVLANLNAQIENGPNHIQASWSHTSAQGDDENVTYHVPREANRDRSHNAVQSQQQSRPIGGATTPTCRKQAVSYEHSYQNHDPYDSSEERNEHRYRHSPAHRQRRQGRQPHSTVKIPAFNGKEDWRVWINRFEAVADRQGWSLEDRLDELLPKLQGSAGDFVFSQLRPEALQDYRSLVEELDCRFRVIETTKTFAAKFSRRNQKPNETVEEYAAELKCLYDKAHRGRDYQTRKEDLVRRFLDGLRDDEIRCEVEYVKDPSDIDEAVFHVVNLIQTRQKHTSSPYNDKKMRKFVRSTRSSESSRDEGDNSDEEYVCQIKPGSKGQKKTTNSVSQDSTNDHKQPKDGTAHEKGVEDLLKQVLGKIEDLAKHNQPKPRDRSCYNCHQEGHFIRNCPLKKKNHSQWRGMQINETKKEDRKQPLNESGPSQMAVARPQ